MSHHKATKKLIHRKPLSHLSQQGISRHSRRVTQLNRQKCLENVNVFSLNNILTKNCHYRIIILISAFQLNSSIQYLFFPFYYCVLMFIFAFLLFTSTHFTILLLFPKYCSYFRFKTQQSYPASVFIVYICMIMLTYVFYYLHVHIYEQVCNFGITIGR